jgi:hypothetical protein
MDGLHKTLEEAVAVKRRSFDVKHFDATGIGRCRSVYSNDSHSNQFEMSVAVAGRVVILCQ